MNINNKLHKSEKETLTGARDSTQLFYTLLAKKNVIISRTSRGSNLSANFSRVN